MWFCLSKMAIKNKKNQHNLFIEVMSAYSTTHPIWFKPDGYALTCPPIKLLWILQFNFTINDTCATFFHITLIVAVPGAPPISRPG